MKSWLVCSFSFCPGVGKHSTVHIMFKTQQDPNLELHVMSTFTIIDQWHHCRIFSQHISSLSQWVTRWTAKHQVVRSSYTWSANLCWARMYYVCPAVIPCFKKSAAPFNQTWCKSDLKSSMFFFSNRWQHLLWFRQETLAEWRGTSGQRGLRGLPVAPRVAMASAFGVGNVLAAWGTLWSVWTIQSVRVTRERSHRVRTRWGEEECVIHEMTSASSNCKIAHFNRGQIYLNAPHTWYSVPRACFTISLCTSLSPTNLIFK